ncbi:LapA family protein [Rhizobiales bacterium 3FA27D7]|jgi:uncharacterized integral membrane protein|uniref:LapA family protein n=1 Tax=Mesorhizobium sp. 2RAF21 TaxID=3232995 RepID=UPI0010F5D925
MFNRFVVIVIFVPLAIVLIALAVANRELVAFTMDPFNPGNPALTLTLPLFVMLFLALAIGIVAGSAATWIRQGRYRKAARRHGAEAENLRQAIARTQQPPSQASTQATSQAPNLPKPTA